MDAEDLSLELNRSAQEDTDPIERIILRSMNEGVITLQCDGTIDTVNPSALRILGLDGQEIRGRAFHNVFSEDHENRRFLEVIERVIHEGLHTLHDEVRFKRRDGQTVDLAIASTFLDYDVCAPGLQNVVVVFRDITAFKSLERARRKAVDHLAHELKTPLAIIDASLERLTRTESAPANHAKILERIRRNLKRLTDIQGAVEEIVTPFPYGRQRFPVVAHVERILAKIEGESSHRSVALRKRLDDVNTDILDPKVLTLVLETLVKNAIENTPDGGEVTVSLGNVASGVLLQVEDHGVGIPISEQEFIFQGFHHTQITDEYASKKPYDFNAGGKGLELLRLKALSESCSFDISFESRPCAHVASSRDHCPGAISECPHVSGPDGCRESADTTFAVLFR